MRVGKEEKEERKKMNKVTLSRLVFLKPNALKVSRTHRVDLPGA